jgi:hypothetical protein
MATRYEVRTFADIVRTVCEALKVQSSDTDTINRIKRNINMVYLNHVVPASNSWTWLDETTTLSVEPYFEAGTVSVQQNVANVVLTQSPATSMVGRYFSVDGNNEIYRVATHSAGSSALTLEGPYTGTTNTEARFKLWTDKVVLPSNCMKVREVITPNASAPLMNVALQQFRKHQISGGALIGSPSYYAEGPMEEPSPYADISGLPTLSSRASAGLTKTLYFDGDPSTLLSVGDRVHVESPNQYTYEGDFTISAVDSDSISYTARIPLDESSTADGNLYLQSMNTSNTSPAPTILVYPSIMQRNQRINMVVDYQAYPSELIADRDEPRIPREHRTVLVDGAMWLSTDRETDLDRSDRYKVYFDQGIQRMLSRSSSTAKTPTMRVSNSYLKSKAGLFGRSRYNSAIGYEAFSGSTGGSNAAPTATGTPNSVAVFDENGYLIGSSDINLDLLEYLIGTQAASSELAPDNATTAIDEFSATDYRTANVQYAVVRAGGGVRAGMFIITTEGTNITYADYAATEIGDSGVDFSADLTGGNFRLLVTTDARGASATVYYKVSLV